MLGHHFGDERFLELVILTRHLCDLVVFVAEFSKTIKPKP